MGDEHEPQEEPIWQPPPPQRLFDPDDPIYYNPSEPLWQRLPYRTGPQPVFTPLFDYFHHTKFGPSFQLPHGVDATPAALLELFLPDSLLDKWVESTNMYARMRLARDRVKPISRSELCRFLAIIFYMGVVRLPSKEDYWVVDDDVLPTHHTLKLHYTRFHYVWRNFHTSFDENSTLDENKYLPQNALLGRARM